MPTKTRRYGTDTVVPSFRVGMSMDHGQLPTASSGVDADLMGDGNISKTKSPMTTGLSGNGNYWKPITFILIIPLGISVRFGR